MPDLPIPFSGILEDAAVPDAERIVTAARSLLDLTASGGPVAG